MALPLQCSQPVNFGDVAIGSTAIVTVNCTALIPITSIAGCTTGDATFQCKNSTLPTGALAKGATFSFPVVWNLTQASINDAQNASFGKVTPGVASSALNIYTVNAVAKYSTLLPISLQGNTISKTAFLAISPAEVDFGGLVLLAGTQQQVLEAAVIVSNIGAQPLVFTGFAWTEELDTPVEWTNVTTVDGSSVIGDGFISSVFPAVGTIIASGDSVTLPLSFTQDEIGLYSSILQFWTTGGDSYVLLSGSVSTSPVANISVSTTEEGWDYSEPVIMDYGSVLAGTTVSKTLRLCNSGGSALEVTKSKPPIQAELTAENPGVDLHEGQFIDVNTCATAPVLIIAAPLGVNRPAHNVSDVWTLNADGINADGTAFGVHDVAVTAQIVTRQIGPLLADGTARYKYLGCYYDGGGRQLSKQYSNTTNDNAWCQTKCLSVGYIFAGTEYRK